MIALQIHMITVKPVVLNNQLKWDGSHIGSYWKAITGKWTLEGIHYYRITLPIGWSKEFPSGIIYCLAIKAKDLFPCIVEDIKDIFGIPRCGIHRINIDYQEYFIYYVPISTDNSLIWETPLNRLNSKHELRRDPEFRKEVQKIIMFSEILALEKTGEPSIRIRLGKNGLRLPISMNESTTTITKALDYDYSIMSKTLFLKWFGEETSMSDTLKEMINGMSEPQPQFLTNHQPDGLPKFQVDIPFGISPRGTRDFLTIPGAVKEINQNNLGIITAQIRSKIDTVIKRYDVNYIWYSNFILDRLSRYLLVL